MQSKRLNSLRKLDPALARKYQNKKAPAFVRHRSKSYVWHEKAGEYKAPRFGKKRKPSRSKTALSPKKRSGDSKSASLSPKLRSLKRIAPSLAQKYQREKKEPPAFLKHESRSYVWNEKDGEYKVPRFGKKRKPKSLASKKLSPKLRSLKKIAPLLAEKYQRENKEPPAFLKHESKRYVWNAKDGEYKVPGFRVPRLEKVKPKRYLWDRQAQDYGYVREDAEPTYFSPKLQSLKKIAPPLAEKYEKASREPPDRLTYKSQNYLWNPGAVKYNLVKKKSRPKPLASASIPKVSRLGVSPSIPAKVKPVTRKKRRTAPARPRKQRLGNLEAGRLLNKIDEALKKHSKKKGDVLDFLVRAYQRYYRKDRLSRQEAIDLMRIGLAYRGSLKAILKNMKREFKERPMRHYVFGKLFNISRHEAKKIFAVYLYGRAG